MKTLIVEDEFISRQILHDIMVQYGTVDLAITGKQALDIFESAQKKNVKYDLVCLDIMLPEMAGQDVLIKLREIEYQNGIKGLSGVKVIMTTALGDFKNIRDAFHSQCEAYLVKPIDPTQLEKTLIELGFQL